MLTRFGKPLITIFGSLGKHFWTIWTSFGSILELIGLQVGTRFPQNWLGWLQVGSKLAIVRANLAPDNPKVSRGGPELVPIWLQVPILEIQSTNFEVPFGEPQARIFSIFSSISGSCGTNFHGLGDPGNCNFRYIFS